MKTISQCLIFKAIYNLFILCALLKTVGVGWKWWFPHAAFAYNTCCQKRLMTRCSRLLSGMMNAVVVVFYFFVHQLIYLRQEEELIFVRLLGFYFRHHNRATTTAAAAAMILLMLVYLLS